MLGFAPEALAALSSYGYPGNVRELRNIVERAVILCSGSEITKADLVIAGPAAEPQVPAVGAAIGAFFQMGALADGSPPPLDAVERAYFARVLQHCEGRRMQAAQALGVSYPTFLKRLREIDPETRG